MSKISVIVPVYNVEKYLNRCIDSILAQTFSDFDLILIDDGSPDNCGKICDEYADKDNRIHVIHQENGGLSAARNAGIDWVFEHSDSEWITFVDSDDWIHPQLLAELFNAAVSKELSIAACDFDEMDFYCLDSKYTPTEYKVVEVQSAYCQYYRFCITATFKLYKKELFTKIRFPLGKLCEDAFTTYKLQFSQKHIVIVDYPFYHIYKNPSSITRSKWSPKRLDEVAAHEEILEFLKSHHYTEAYNYEIFRYMRVLKFQFWHIKNSYNEKNSKKYLMCLSKKMRKAIRLYKRSNSFALHKNITFYECGYPKLINIYLILNKIFYKKNIEY